MTAIKEIQPGKRYVTRIYLSIMLWVTGRAVQAAARADREVAKEFERIPENYRFSLGAFPNGPYMVVGKLKEEGVKYLGWSPQKQDVDLEMTLKSTGLLFTLFTFRESTPVANARDRLYVSGDVPQACTIVRILDIVQVYLLPKPIAKLAVKRYPRWPLKRHTLTRAAVWVRTLLGI